MARSGRPAPEPEKVAKALHLRRTTDMTLRQIATEIGVSSPATVSNYLAIAENAETWFPMVNRREIGRNLNLIYATVMDRLLKRLDDDDAEPEKVATAIRGIGQELARIHGLYAPTRTAVEMAQEPATPDPETTAAIQTVLAELEAAERNGDVPY